MPKRLSKPKPKRPRDVNQLAYQLVQESTAEPQETATITRSEISRIMSEMGRKGGRISGARRKQNFSPEKRSEIALKAATERWKKKKEELQRP